MSEAEGGEGGGSSQQMSLGWAGEALTARRKAWTQSLRIYRRQAEVVFWKTQFVRQACGITCGKGDPEAGKSEDKGQMLSVSSQAKASGS